MLPYQVQGKLLERKLPRHRCYLSPWKEGILRALQVTAHTEKEGGDKTQKEGNEAKPREWKKGQEPDIK